MSSIGFPIFVVGVLLAGTAAAIIVTPRDLLRSTVVSAPSPYLAESATVSTPRPAALPDVPVVQVASMTVEVTPLSEPGTSAATFSPVGPVAAQPAAAAKDLRRITAGVLNMRSEPSKYAELLASLPRDTVVSVLETSGTWAYVTTPDGTTGWLSQNFLASVQ